MSVFVCFVFEHLQDDGEKEMRRAMLENRIGEIQRQFEIIETHDNEIRTLKHDLNNQLDVFSKLSVSGRTDEILEYAVKLSGYMADTMKDSITGIAVIDAIIAIKKEKAARQNTEFSVITDEVKKIVINPIHLNIVLGNALDNALEACNRLPEERRRYIELALKTKDGFLYIRVTNSAHPVKQKLNGLPISSKRVGEQPGYGLESIRRMIDSYNGIFEFEVKNGEFILGLRMKNAPVPRRSAFNVAPEGADGL